MVLFDYRCEDCLTIFERLVENSSVDNVMCKECGGVSKKIPSAVGLLVTNFHDKPSVKKR